MNNEKGAEGTDVWKATAKGYAAQVGRLTSSYAHDMINLICHPYMEQAKTILDVGCGTGAFVLAYIQLYPQGIEGQTIISSDLSPSMMEQAELAIDKALAAANNNPSDFRTKLLYQIEDGTKLSGIETASIDIVVSLYGVFLIPDQTATLQSIRRVLKPQTGIFVNSAWTKPASSIEPSFGSNLQTVFFTLMDTIKGMTANASSPDTHISVVDTVGASYMEWVDPIMIESNLTEKYQLTTKYNTTTKKNNINTHRTFHSLVVPNIDTMYNVLITNPMIGKVQLLSSEQLQQLKEKFVELCLPQYHHTDSTDSDMTTHNQEMCHRIVEQNEPFTLWSSSNITIVHMT